MEYFPSVLLAGFIYLGNFSPALIVSGETFNEIATAYKEELEVRRCIVENVARSETDEDSLVYLGAWMFPARLSSQVNLALEAMLVETGHR